MEVGRASGLSDGRSLSPGKAKTGLHHRLGRALPVSSIRQIKWDMSRFLALDHLKKHTNIYSKKPSKHCACRY